MPFERYTATVPGWATAVELTSELPVEGTGRISLPLDEKPIFIVGVVTTPNGHRPLWLDGELRIEGFDLQARPTDNDHIFVSEKSDLVIVNHPSTDTLDVRLSSSGRFPVAASVMAFHQSGPTPPASAPPGSPSFRCRACKITAKALALAIVAAAALPTIPAALIAAVGSFLGVSAVIAGTFIGSVIGDTADVIAEKLCLWVRLCP